VDCEAKDAINPRPTIREGMPNAKDQKLAFNWIAILWNLQLQHARTGRDKACPHRSAIWHQLFAVDDGG
jgi:hypothetical protein